MAHRTARLVPLALLLWPALAAADDRRRPPDCTEVLAFVRQYVESLPAELRVPRGAFALAYDGQVTCSYGFGRTAAGDDVDPARTVFRAASNSKLVTATAVMQLVEAGRWRLADEVNRYLPHDVQLPRPFGPSVTIEHLLTHTSGFEDTFAGALTTPERQMSLASFFRRHTPRVVIAPGTAISYSNIGVALAGYLVEAATGEPFDHYAARAIFRPLAMERTTFDQRIPDGSVRDIAGGLPPAPRRIVFNPYPAAALSTTAVDIARFLAAHLGGGAIAGGGRMLGADAVRTMHAAHWRPQPAVPGVALGFFEGRENGRRTLFHTGDSGDHSIALLLPDERVGFFLVYSGQDGQAAVRERFTRQFLDRFYPALGPPEGGHYEDSAPRPSERGRDGDQVVSGFSRTASALTPAAALQPLAGTYRNIQYSRSNYEKLKALVGHVTIRAAGDGVLEISPPGAPRPITVRETEPLVFRADGGEVLAFPRGGTEAATRFTLSGFVWDPATWERVPQIDDARLHGLLGAGVVAVLLARTPGWSIAGLVARVRRRRMTAWTAAERRWWRWSGLVSAWMLAGPVVGIATAFLSFTHPAIALPRAAVIAGLWLSLGACGSAVLAPIAVHAWRRGMWTFARRLQFTATSAALVVAGALLLYWRVAPLPW